MAGTRGGGIRAQQRRDTQQRILAAARRLFAEVGYERTTIRAIAAAAQADPGLVIRYYGSKQQLFDRVADMPAEDILIGNPDEIAERILASLSAKLAAEPTATLAVLRSMLTHPDASAQVSAASDRTEQQLAEAIGGADAALRAGLVGAITLGVVIGRHLVRLNGLQDIDPERIVDMLRPHIHALLSGEDSHPPRTAERRPRSTR